MAASLRGLHPQVREAAEWALAWARHYDVPVTVTSTLRPWAQQQRLRERFEKCVREGRFPTPGTECAFPANRPGDSAHQFGLAWDSVVPSWAQSWWDEVRRLAGFHVLPNDRIHAEVPQWRSYVGS